MTAALVCLLLAAPPGKKQWSVARPVGLWVPRSYKTVARDEGSKVLVAEGPRLGAGIPRLVLWHAGPATETLEEMAGRLLKPVKARPGWSVTARQRKTIGAFPAIRFGLRFTEGGGQGRGRFTVALLGGDFYVLELSAHAARFPGAIFDRIEQSLAVRWTEHRLAGGLVVRLPPGWTERDGQFLGPRLEGRASVLRIWRDDGLRGPRGSRPGPALEFLGAKRPTLTAERDGARMRVVHAAGWSARFVLPQEGWDDLAPTVEAILADARLPRAPGNR